MEERDAERLVLELQHRVKNMAAVVRGIARRTAETSFDLDEFQARFDGRLAALVRAHAANARTTLAGVDLEEIVAETLLENALARDNWRIEGPPVRLELSLVETLSLLIHELAVESALHGALGEPEGRLVVSWAASDGRLALTWREQGLADRQPPEDFEFAQELLDQGLAYQFEGSSELRVEPTGLACVIEVPLRPVSSP